MSSTADEKRRPRLEKLPSMARRALWAGAVGTLMEWYDYALYGAAAGLVMGVLFFPELGGTGGTLAAMASFGVGFFARPVGGLVMANLGDRIGRKPILIVTVVLMGAATMGMGLLPTYLQLGIWAPILLVILRFLQGLGAGAELAGAMTVVAEFSPLSRRAFVMSVPMACASGGVLLATVAFLATSSLSEDVFLTWGWRIPFLLSGLLFVIALYIRNRLEETPEFLEVKAKNEAGQKRRMPMAELVKRQPRSAFLGVLSITGHNANFYILMTFAVSYTVNTLEMGRNASLIALGSAAVSALFATLIAGRIADRIGVLRTYLFGAMATTLCAFPLTAALMTGNLAVICVALIITAAVGVGATSAGQGPFLSDMFPAEYRFSGIAFSREVNTVLVSGPTPFIATLLVAVAGGAAWLVGAYLAVCGLISALAILLTRSIKPSDRGASPEPTNPST